MVEPTVELPGGVRMPLVGLGTWKASGEDAYRAVLTALEVGYRHVDTATVYGNETEVGRALAGSGLPREEVFVTSKLAGGDVGHVRAAIEASLGRLGTDHLDLWLIHWPPGHRARPDVWGELLALRDEGLTRTVGVSNYEIGQIDALVRASGEAPAVNQIRFGPALWDAALVADHRGRGVVVEGYSPFRTTNLRARVLGEIAGRHGTSPAQVVLRWHLQRGIVAIPKSTDPGRIAANFALWDFALDDDDLAAIDGLGARRWPFGRR